MASIRKERTIEATPEAVWDALSDWGAIHERLVPGFVVDARLDGEDRIVTFFNGALRLDRRPVAGRDRRGHLRDDGAGHRHRQADPGVRNGP
jgi:hypothetical protein